MFVRRLPGYREAAFPLGRSKMKSKITTLTGAAFCDGEVVGRLFKDLKHGCHPIAVPEVNSQRKEYELDRLSIEAVNENARMKLAGM